MLRVGSIGLNFLAKMMLSATGTTPNASGLKVAINRLRLLRDTLQEHGGIFAKVAQMLSLDTPNAEVFDECRSRLSQPTHEDFLQHVDQLGFEVEPQVIKSGSLSHLYVGTVPDGTKVAIKVQYVGLKERCDADLYAVKLLASLLYKFPDMAMLMDEVSSKIRDELDYVLEAESQAWFADTLRVRVPRVYRQFSTPTRLVSEFVEGEDFGAFVTHASLPRKHAIARELCRFLFGALWGHRTLYSDVHFGNLLVDKDDRLVVLDFGCVHRFEPEFMGVLARIWDDPSIQTLREVGILPDSLTAEETKYAAEYFAMQLEPWKTPGFVFEPEWMAKATDRDQGLMANWLMPRGVLYLNKVVYSLYNVLASLNAPGIYWPTTQHVLDDCL
jgi:predicted unusual protein kinase regulating ubiquinone biosynthesis (AarF/ABC1/UbiB family)